MKKTFTFFRALASVLLAVAAIFSCTLKEEPFNEPSQPVVDRPRAYTLTITAGNAATKALHIDGSTGALSATWGPNDKVQVVKGTVTLGALDVQTISADGKTATFSGSLSETITAEEELVLWYNNKGYSAFGDQDGTLDSAGEHDCAKATVTVKSVDPVTGHVTLKEEKAVFNTQTAMIKFTLTSDGVSRLNPSTFKLSANLGVTNDIFTFTISTDIRDGILYFALPDKDDFAAKLAEKTHTDESTISEILASLPVTVTATCGGVDFTGSVTGYPFTRNNYYAATLTLTPPYYAAKIEDIGKIIATDGNIYATVGDIPSDQTAAAMIAFVETGFGCAHGLAISLTDAYAYNATFAEATGEAIIPSWATYHPLPGGTWRLPTEPDLQRMIWGYYSDSPSGSASATAAAKSVLAEGYYWTSTVIDSDYAKGMYYDGSAYASVQSLKKTDYYHVRACLAF